MKMLWLQVTDRESCDGDAKNEVNEKKYLPYLLNIIFKCYCSDEKFILRLLFC